MRISKIEVYIHLLCIALLALMPVSIYTRYAITIGTVKIWINVLILYIFLIVTTFFHFKMGDNQKKIKGYELIYILFCTSAFVIGLLKSLYIGGTSMVVEAFMVLFIPFIVYKRISQYQHYESIVSKGIVLIGDLVSLEVLLYIFANNFISRFMGWSSISSDGSLIRPPTTLGGATTTAIYIFCIFAISFTKSMGANNKKLKIYYYSSSFIQLLSILLLLTRSAILLVGLFLLYVLFTKSFKNKNRSKLIVAIVIFCVAVYFVYPQIYSEIFYRFTSGEDSNLGRKNLLNGGINAFKQNPIFGTGIGLGIIRLVNIETVESQIINPHNQHIGLIVETGIFGYIMFFVFSISALVYYCKKIKKSSVKYILFAYAIVFFVGFCFEQFTLVDIRYGIITWLMLAEIDLINTSS